MLGLDKCIVRKVGFDLYVDLHVRVHGDHTVHDGHRIAHDVKDAIRAANARVRDVTIHVEPATAEEEAPASRSSLNKRRGHVDFVAQRTTTARPLTGTWTRTEHCSDAPSTSLPPSPLSLPSSAFQNRRDVTDMRILVADKLADEGLEFLKESGVAFDVKVGLKDETSSPPRSPEYDALIVRSGAKVDRQGAGEPRQAQGDRPGRASASTTSTSPPPPPRASSSSTPPRRRTLSTAEHALALMFSLARKIPAAHAGLTSGALEWKKRSVYQGTQLAGKTLGVVGLGPHRADRRHAARSRWR